LPGLFLSGNPLTDEKSERDQQGKHYGGQDDNSLEVIDYVAVLLGIWQTRQLVLDGSFAWHRAWF